MNYIKPFIYAAITGLIVVIVLFATEENSRKREVEKTKVEKEINEVLTYALEQAYFEGQLDATNNDVRISRVDDSTFVWTRSPWDSGRAPLFIPNKETFRKSKIRLK